MRDTTVTLDKLHEECSVFGIYNTGNHPRLQRLLLRPVCPLQHRGVRRAAALPSMTTGVIQVHRDVGLVNESLPRTCWKSW